MVYHYARPSQQCQRVYLLAVPSAVFLLAYFFAGIFLVNGIPHFVHGISGNRFSSPFAEPPEGKSSAVVNVIWGMVNFVIGYALIVGVGSFALGFTLDALMVGIGALVTAVGLAWHFGRRSD